MKRGEVDLKGPLAGIPVSLKDSIQVGGFDVSVGYSKKTGKPYQEDGPMVKLLKDAGTIYNHSILFFLYSHHPFPLSSFLFFPSSISDQRQ